MKSLPRSVLRSCCLLMFVGLSVCGCLNVSTPREINVSSDVGTRQHVDTSSVPPTGSHEEARQRLADAYAEIRSLRSDVAKLERDKKELKRERDDCRDELKQVEKDLKKMRKEADE